MALLWNAVASGLLVALALTLLGWRAEAQGNGRDKVGLRVTFSSNDTFLHWAVLTNEDSPQFGHKSSPLFLLLLSKNPSFCVILNTESQRVKSVL